MTTRIEVHVPGEPVPQPRAKVQVLTRRDGSVVRSRSAIADRLSISPCNVPDVIKALVGQGMVLVVREARDRRRYVVREESLRRRPVRTPAWTKPRYGRRPRIQEGTS